MQLKLYGRNIAFDLEQQQKMQTILHLKCGCWNGKHILPPTRKKDSLDKPDAITMLRSLSCNSLIIFLCHRLWLTSETILITFIPLGAWQKHCKYLLWWFHCREWVNVSPKGDINSGKHNTHFSHCTLFFLHTASVGFEWQFVTDGIDMASVRSELLTTSFSQPIS